MAKWVISGYFGDDSPLHSSFLASWWDRQMSVNLFCENVPGDVTPAACGTTKPCECPLVFFQTDYASQWNTNLSKLHQITIHKVHNVIMLTYFVETFTDLSTFICWLVVSTYPSEKWWSSSLGMIIQFPIWMQSHKIPWFQTTNQIYDILLFQLLTIINH